MELCAMYREDPAWLFCSERKKNIQIAEVHVYPSPENTQCDEMSKIPEPWWWELGEAGEWIIASDAREFLNLTK